MNRKYILLIGLLCGVLIGSMSFVNASDVTNLDGHGMTYDTDYGPAHLKSGSLESETFTTFDNPYESELMSHEVNLDTGESWMIYYKLNSGSDHEIIGAHKIVNGTVIENKDLGVNNSQSIDIYDVPYTFNHPYVFMWYEEALFHEYNSDLIYPTYKGLTKVGSYLFGSWISTVNNILS